MSVLEIGSTRQRDCDDDGRPSDRLAEPRWPTNDRRRTRATASCVSHYHDCI